jgi:hypothetical protein
VNSNFSPPKKRFGRLGNINKSVNSGYLTQGPIVNNFFKFFLLNIELSACVTPHKYTARHKFPTKCFECEYTFSTAMRKTVECEYYEKS